jgi:peptide/nickel transport system ATP-binding protein
MTPPLLSIDGLGVAIGGAPIIRNLSLQVGSGEILGLVGASGSGKSMTALAIMQLLPPRARVTGAVTLRGAALMGRSEAQLQRVRGRDIGMVFQEPMTALNPAMKIGDQVAETVRLHQAGSAAQARAQARGALDSVGLSGAQGALDRYPHELSGGQRQRVAIAIAIVLRPALLIADEPTTALDVSTQAQVLLLLRDLARSRAMGLLLVSHDLAVIAQVTDRVAVMSEGEIVEHCATPATLRHLRHPYARALLAAAELAPKRHSPVIDASSAVLSVRDVVREYRLPRRSFWGPVPRLRAVDGVSLTVHPGETVGLVGESGSGKSSLLRAILGLQRTQAGEVRLSGEVFPTTSGAAMRRLRRSIQAVFQDPYGSFDPQWSVERLIAEPFHLMDSPPSADERRRKVAMALEQVGLSPADAHRRPHEFSGGQRQRIAIARALITQPALLVFDEAVSALDVLVRAQVLDLLADLSGRLRLAYLFVSHDLTVVRAIADRIYVMQRGRIVEEGPTATVFESPQHEYTKSLIAATPQIGAALAARQRLEPAPSDVAHRE